MEAVVQQYHVDKQCFEIQMKRFLIENDRLLDQIISQDIVNVVVNSSRDINTSVNVNSSIAMDDSVNYVEMCNKVSRSTKSSISKSIDNTKNDRILQISSSTQKKNKVEVHYRIVKSSLYKSNSVVEPSRNENAQHSKLNTNSELMITTTNKVHLREPIPLEVIAQESIVTKVYTKRPKVPKTNSSNSKPKIAKFVISNKTEPGTSRGSNNLVAPSSSSVDLRISRNKDLCGPMRVARINRKNYILVIMDDYSRFTWVKFLASKDKAPNFIIKFLKMIQVRFNMPVRNNHLDNRAEFVNQTLRSYYESVGISHDTSVVRCPQQNGVVERQNRTLVEAARTMLIYVKASLFIWAEDFGKLRAKADIGIFIGYAPKKKAYRIYNQRTRKIIETIHVDFDELTAMDYEQLGSGRGLQYDWDHLFQPIFDEYFNPPTIAISPVSVANASRAVDLAYSPVSTSIDQNAPSISIPSTQDQEHSPIISQGFKESSKTPHFHDDPLHESLQEDSTS
ncbi:retrovirus-related pol polyprotein from transposon TNT 1-94 [Tanacetum coccineum]